MRCRRLAACTIACVWLASDVWPSRGAAGAAVREEVFRRIERTIAIEGPSLLRVQHHGGLLRIRTHARREVRVEASIRVSANSRDVAARFADRIELEVADMPGQVTIGTKPIAIDRRFPGVSFAIDMEVLMPADMRLDARQNFGPVDVSGLEAGATIENALGPIRVSGVRGPYRLRNRFGPIDVANLAGDLTIAAGNSEISASSISGSVVATNSFGRVALRDIGQQATVHNSTGAITAHGLHGGGELSSSFGDIEAEMVRGHLTVRNANAHVRLVDMAGTAFLKTAFGTVVLDRIDGTVTVENSNGSVRGTALSGAANISTSFGAVILRDAGGRLDVRNPSGTVDVGLAVRPERCADSILETNVGPLFVHVPGGGYTVTARAVRGRVRSEVPITATGRTGASVMSGTIGGGGCALRLTNTNGNITIRPGAGTVVDLVFDRPSRGGRGRATRPTRAPRN